MRSRKRLMLLWIAFFLTLSVACSEERRVAEITEIPGTQFLFRVSGDGFYDIPFPNDLRLKEDGTINLTNFPNPLNVDLLDGYLKIISESTRGFGTNSAIYFRFTSSLDAGSLPQEPIETLIENPSIFLVDIDPESPEMGKKLPLMVRFQKETKMFLPENSLILLPVSGFTLRGANLYAVVITNKIMDEEGKGLGSPLEFEMIKYGVHEGDETLKRTIDLYRPLFEFLEEEEFSLEDVAAATVFTTQDPTGELFRIREYLFNLDTPEISITTCTQDSQFYLCEGNYSSPQFQAGELPFLEEGGGLVFDSDGEPLVQRVEELRFALTIPSGTEPSGGWPLVTYAHGTGGDYKTFINSEVASYLSGLGIAAISIDQLLHDQRHPTGDESGMIFFNYFNIMAGRDNVRQSAIDSIVLYRVARTLKIDDTQCPPCKDINFNPDKVLFMGHSQGSLTGAPFIGVEPLVRGAVLSGAGGGLAISLLAKTKPFDVKSLVESLLEIKDEEELDIFHPVVNILQTYIEPADSLNYAIYYVLEPLEGGPKNIFISEGLLDEYTPPETTEALATAAGINQIEPVARLIEGLSLRGLEPLSPPVTGNIEEMATAGIIQYPEDGHFAVFDNPEAESQYGEFLKSLAEDGISTIVPDP